MSPERTLHQDYESPVLEPIAICGMACRLPGGIDSDSSFWRMLVEKRTGQTRKVPASRFNIDAHYHERLDRPGSFNVLGGYFLDGRLEDFDPSFFNITPIEAQWLDPQQRKMLEVSFECLVSAGIPLETIAGSNTAVFVGSFTSDYQQISTREPDFRHNYTATGVDPGIISNRIGHVFNLRGPSFTINTACSSSVYAIHNACHALRARDCDAAIAGGVNLILTVDQHMNTAKLSILSPTSTCNTFDAAADGYGRAEGAGALFLKRLSDAIRDGNPIRGVIRSSAVNTNGKVGDMGLTHPSVEGQERVIRIAYDKAQLNPSITAYSELHGTGTPVGDPIEVRAVSNAMNDTRPKHSPLLIGAVKPNIGHSEAASGIFAVMKAALMTERAQIPGVALFRSLNPAILEKEWNVQVQVDTAPWPADFVRRASVSSFGYGGTNGHVIVESIESLNPWYQHAKVKQEAPYDHTCERPLLLCFSSHDKATLSRNLEALSAVYSRYYLADLAHTLNLHRTMLPNRAFTIALDGQESDAFNPNTMQTGVANKKIPSTAFLFTGQGAQWAGMAKKAFRDFAVFMDVIARLDHVLSKYKPDFKMVDILLDDSAMDITRLNEAEIAQPLCTAIQIALVDLLAFWNIVPEVSIGHSSGEIGAAYAAGLLSAPEAIVSAFCRGCAVKSESTPGSMLAVGLGSEEVLDILPIDAELICIACENSPRSVTLSGKSKNISEFQKLLTARGIFAKELATGRAYHSPHMARVASAYDAMLSHALPFLTEDDNLWRRPRSNMISSVTGELVHTRAIPPGYWSDNLRQRVRFNTAVQLLGTDKDLFGHVSHVVEIGPHSALSGPFKQICLANKFDHFSYVPSLVRNTNDSEQLLSVAGALYLAGYKVNLEAVNSESYGTHLHGKTKTQYLLVDLPNYQWNYEKTYWAESRTSIEQRRRAYPRHDLLGSRVAGIGGKTKAWRNILRHRDIPWFKDHNLGGTAIFPAAGYLSIAIEALRQIHESQNLPFERVILRDVDIKTALTLPDNEDGVEIMLSLETTDKSGWHSFWVESFNGGEWIAHCMGKVSATYVPSTTQQHPMAESSLTQRVSGRTWYKRFQRVGFNYGKTFQQLKNVRTDRSIHYAAADVIVLENSGIMVGESRSIIHPSTIDACIQLSIISIHAGHKEMPWGVVPTRIEEVSISFPDTDACETGHAVAWTDSLTEREFNTNICLSDQNGKLLVNFQNLTCVAYEAALPAGGSTRAAPAEPFSITSWKPDIAKLGSNQFQCLWPEICLPVDRLVKFIDLISHRQPVNSVLVIVNSSIVLGRIRIILESLPDTAGITVALIDPIKAEGLVELASRATVITLSSLYELLGESTSIAAVDLILIGSLSLGSDIPPSNLMPLINGEGWLVGSSDDNPHFPSMSALQIGREFAIQKSEVPEKSDLLAEIVLLSISLPVADDLLHSLAEALSSSSGKVRRECIASFSSGGDHNIIIDDTAGNLLSSIDEPSFAALKTVLLSGVPVLWLTSGVRQGRCVLGGMAEGFLRAIRSEHAAAKIVLVDTSQEEQLSIVAQTLIKTLPASLQKSGQDVEFWLHQGIVNIPRVFAHRALNEEWSETTRRSIAQEEPLPKGLQLIATPSDGAFVFHRGTKDTEIAENEVEIQTLASELQTSRDSMVLIVGTIIRVGSSLLDLSLVGKQVLACSHDGFQTLMRASTYVMLENMDVSPDKLIETMITLSSLISFCLPGSNKLSQGGRVLCLPGSRASMEMLAMLAGFKGWKLSLVVDSEQEKQQYMSQPHLSVENVFLSEELGAILTFVRAKSDAIIAHQFSPLSQEVWRSTAGGIRFFLLSSTNASPDSLPFRRGASFIPIGEKDLDTDSLQFCLDFCRGIQVEANKPTNGRTHLLDVADLCTPGWGSTKESQPVIVNYNYGESLVQILPPKKTLRFSAHKTFLLVGCLGGLGRSLTRWMMERGAKHFAFISRSGADKIEAARVVDGIKQQNGSAQVFRTDACDGEAVRQIALDLQQERPIGGAVHAAMVLKDGFFEEMDHKSFVEVIKPKVNGALSLHNALQDVDLDFFVMTSSISAVIGNKGQSNYSAANSFLDTLAFQRNINGLVGTSLVLPMVLGVGIVAENDNLEKSMNRTGLYGIDEHEMLRGFETAMSRARPLSQFNQPHTHTTESQIIMGMDAAELAQSIDEAGGIERVDTSWYDDPRFCHIRTSIQRAANKSPPSGAGGDESFAKSLKTAQAKGPDAVVEVIAQYIAKRASNILMIPLEHLELGDNSIASYGLDSMIGAEMRTWLFKEFGLDYPFQKLLASTLTFLNLAKIVAVTLGVL